MGDAQRRQEEVKGETKVKGEGLEDWKGWEDGKDRDNCEDSENTEKWRMSGMGMIQGNGSMVRIRRQGRIGSNRVEGERRKGER